MPFYEYLLRKTVRNLGFQSTRMLTVNVVESKPLTLHTNPICTQCNEGYFIKKTLSYLQKAIIAIIETHAIIISATRAFIYFNLLKIQHLHIYHIMCFFILCNRMQNLNHTKKNNKLKKKNNGLVGLFMNHRVYVITNKCTNSVNYIYIC